ncbi:pyridoxamine 5'-phosphate oxidase family protein [uncultured Nocardioides sp.]|uniref:pyridoxamine 5'-phosphate oxidase family protein n=1 Tax=uncultured Nocardioides sp. TaxID=198441 RepID=UPI002607E215|nr:pyridoxamine 5'-phosphate oxidase family protein [uncultured Nocardioides sp.]
MTTAAPLSPTPRTALTRSRERAATDRAELADVLRDTLVAHLGVTVGEGDEAHPVVLPVAIAVDPDGPDEGGSLYLHGSVAAGWLASVRDRTVCVTATHLDGLVAARSGFHHSMNYRSAVVIGRCRVVEDPDERARALDAVVDHMVPGRAATLRPPTRKELAATAVLAVPLAEASVKRRAGGPVDEETDVEAGGWAGVIPLCTVAGAPEADAWSPDEVPADVAERARELGAR